MEDCKGVGEESLKFLAVLKLEKPGSGKIAAGASELQKSIRGLQRKADVREISPVYTGVLIRILITGRVSIHQRVWIESIWIESGLVGVHTRGQVWNESGLEPQCKQGLY